MPNGLLRSIGQVETGNRPWSVDRDGSGVSFASADDAISYVEQEATSARYVDVGCFQIDLAYHPDAFRSLAEAFDPVANAMAAGRYLLSLRRGTSSWPEAVGRYHSGQPDPGRAYAARVYASLLAGPSGRGREESQRGSAGIRSGGPTAYEMAPGGRAVLPQARGLPVVQTP